jgi:predicted O-methyltransferase YrrM
MHMNKTFYRIKDRLEEWYRYSQPTTAQKKLLGMYTDVIDYDFTAVRLASESSARYMIENMRAVPNFETDYDLHDWVVETQIKAIGSILEFGVATGRTANHFARLRPNDTIYGFDSFEGLPEDWTSRMPKGFFKRDALPTVRSNVKLQVGWFDNTLPIWKVDHGNRPIALLHIDSDLYSSAVTILTELKDNIVPGTVIVFDEYINYPGWELDEFKAWQEHVKKHKIKYAYIGRVSKHQKVAIRILK